MLFESSGSSPPSRSPVKGAQNEGGWCGVDTRPQGRALDRCAGNPVNGPRKQRHDPCERGSKASSLIWSGTDLDKWCPSISIGVDTFRLVARIPFTELQSDQLKPGSLHGAWTESGGDDIGREWLTRGGRGIEVGSKSTVGSQTDHDRVSDRIKIARTGCDGGKAWK